MVRPGGRVLAAEFYRRRPPTEEAKRLFLGEVCPGLRFDSVQEWAEIHASAGLVEIRTETGPFQMTAPRGFLADEGVHAAAVVARGLSGPSYLRKMAWLLDNSASVSRVGPSTGADEAYCRTCGATRLPNPGSNHGRQVSSTAHVQEGG